MVSTRPKKGGEADAVRFNVYLPREAYESLEKLRKLSGKRSLAETIRSALKLYLIVQEGLEDGKHVILEDKSGKEREKLRLIYL
jgi:hypothetical protein